MTLWTMNIWGVAHQNAAVFVRNLGHLVKAPLRVRRMKNAVVIHTVYGVIAKDGIIQPQDAPQLLPLPQPPDPSQPPPGPMKH